MSIYKNGKLVAGGSQALPLLCFMWSDHQLNHPSWLNSITFSWQSGAVYQAAYQHLVDDIPTEVIAITVLVLSTPIVYDRYTDGDVSGARHPYCWQIRSGTGKIYTDSETPSVGDFTYTTAQATQEDLSINSIVLPSPETETIAGVTVSFYTAADGHKLVLPDQESNVTAIYAATGVAWYYILDTVNQRFKLPRTKFGFTGIRSGVGNYVSPGIPNITGKFSPWGYQNQLEPSGVFYQTGTGTHAYSAGDAWVGSQINFDASRSSSVYGASDTVQSPATEMYLYFYVGNFTQTALENTAGLNAELFNGKVDAGHQVIAFQEPTAANNYTWYRKYADGCVEQAGFFVKPDSGGGFMTVNLPITMTDTHYTALTTIKNEENNSTSFYIKAGNLTTTSFQVKTGYSSDAYRYDFWWQVSGIAA